ncbi:XdhC family protein [Chloroflexota bacterium]
MNNIYQEIARITFEGKEAALITIISSVGSTPRKGGTKMLVMADGSILGSIGGGTIEAQVCKQAIEVISIGKPKRVHFKLRKGDKLGMVCGGDMEVFIEPILSPPTMYLFGGGHISLALANISKLLGFKIAIIDDRVEFAKASRFPEADIIVVEDFGKVFPQLKITESDYIVIVTRHHHTDEMVLEHILRMNKPVKYVGMIGSKTKNKTIFSHLTARGISQELLNKVHAPIGLEIYAETPQEIAISILAEIIMVRRSQMITSSKTAKLTNPR